MFIKLIYLNHDKYYKIKFYKFVFHMLLNIFFVASYQKLLFYNSLYEYLNYMLFNYW